ncbi:hypothetical protein OAK51_04190 [Alphaproteobacteria bacterium]|nr:hypothetical protein [Alphaproteobacteria bacterium]
MKNNFFKIFVFIILNLQFFSSYAGELQLDNIKNKINEIKNMEGFVSGSPESQMLLILQDITNQLNKNKTSKTLIQDTLTVLDTTDFIEERFPQVTQLNFPENFLVGSNLSIADLANASFFLNSLNSKRLKKLKNLRELSQTNSVMSKINVQIIEDLSLEPSNLIQQLEKMPKLDLVALSSSINIASTSILKNTDIVSNNLNDVKSTASSAITEAASQVESATTTLSRAAGAAMAAASYSLDQAATEIANSISAGVSVDLDAAAQGLGHDNFASAVEAYNEQYGTNYTVESAKEALGQ